MYRPKTPNTFNTPPGETAYGLVRFRAAAGGLRPAAASDLGEDFVEVGRFSRIANVKEGP